MSLLKTFRSGLCAGILISLGGSVFLGCENRIVGSFLFAVALLCICYKGYYLFTGKICYLCPESCKCELPHLAVGLLGNLLAVWICGVLLRIAVPTLGQSAVAFAPAKLGQSFLQTFIRATFCGFLVYLAVSVYKESNSPLAAIYGVPAFIFSGFEHSIADFFYFSAASMINGRIVGFMLAVLAGNMVGGLILPNLMPKEEA